MSRLEPMNKFFEQREKQIIKEASQIAKDVARKELALLEFEMFYKSMIPQQSKEKAEKNLKKLRSLKWQEALKGAGGDEEKAMLIYGAA